MKILVIRGAYINVRKSLFCCNLACLVWETQRKLETFAEATGYDYIIHLIVRSN